MATNITFTEVVTKLQAVAETAGAASVKVGLYQNDFDRTKELDTPTVFIEPQNSTVGNATITRNFQISVYDLLNHEQTDLVAKTNSTEVVALAIIANLINSFANRDYEVTVASLEWYTEHDTNTYTGWVINIQILSPYAYSIC